MTAKITDKLVRDLTPPQASNRITYDIDIKGFGVRVTKNGARSFILNYRANARERRLTIGAYPAWSVAAAREEARKLRRRVDMGQDPLAHKQDTLAAPTMSDLCDRYIKEYLPRKRPGSNRNDLSMIKRQVIPRLGITKVANIHHTDIERLHRDIGQTTPYQANRVLALLSRMLSLAIKWGWRTDNPAKGIERHPEEKRQRYLSAEEWSRLFAIMAGHPNQRSANAIRLLLLTGARRNEALGATWDQLDLEKGIWIKPSAHTKQKRPHRVPLSIPAVELLRNMKAESSGQYLFPGNKPGKHLTEIKKFWASVCRQADLNGIRIHDLRHTYASVLASAGISLPIIGQLLGHTQPGTTAQYAHLFDDPLREATNIVGQVVLAER